MSNDAAAFRRVERVVRLALRDSRRDADVTQQELAGRLGWSRNMVANMESGRRAISMADFLMVAFTLRVEPEGVMRLVQQRLQVS